MIGHTTALATALQAVEVEGGSAAIAVAALLVLGAAAVLSVGVAYRLYRGYRDAGDPGQLALATGLVLLTTVPTTLRFVLPMATGGLPTARIAATTVSELAGLAVMVYAIRGPPAERRRRHRKRVKVRGVALPAPFVLALAAVVPHLGLLSRAVTAAAGLYVARLAYRGYRRNESRPMGYLAAGIALLTVAPFVLALGLEVFVAGSDAAVILGMAASQLLGVVAILHSLTRA